MFITIIYYLVIIIVLIYYYHHYLQYHFWYHLKRNLGGPKFYLGNLHPNIYSKKNLTEYDKNELIKLYKNYMNGVIINKSKIENFLSTMPHSEIFYMKVNSIYYGAVMNSIVEIKYKNNLYLTNFVDNAIINKNYRNKGIFKELMNYIANYSNKMNVKFIIFKIDKKPIPTFYEYNFTSNYYYLLRPYKKINNIFVPVYKLKNTKDMIILICSGKNKQEDNIKNYDNNFIVSDFIKIPNVTSMIFKRNSPESIELLYITNPIKINILNIIEYLYNNFTFDILFVDDIGNNTHLINAFGNSFKIAYPVYHYILGLNEKIEKNKFFYYF